MADAVTLIKTPSEKMSDFNKRLKEACNQQDVTSVQIIVVDGEPVVTLFCETVDATQEDVDAAKADGDAITLGEPIPEEAPVIAQVTRVTCGTDEGAVKSQERMERLFERAEGGVCEVLNAFGSRFGFIEGPDKKSYFGETQENYLLVTYLSDVDGEDTSAEDAKMEANLRPAKVGK